MLLPLHPYLALSHSQNSGIPNRVGEMLSNKVVKYIRSSLCFYRCRLHRLWIYSLVRVDHSHLDTPSFPHVTPSLPAAIIMWIPRGVMDKAWPYGWLWCCKIRNRQHLSFSDALFHHLHRRELFKTGGKIKQVWAEESFVCQMPLYVRLPAFAWCSWMETLSAAAENSHFFGKGILEQSSGPFYCHNVIFTSLL